jgi:hypothetical protein
MRYIYICDVCVCVCVGKDKNLKIWRESDGEHHKDTSGHKSTVYCLAFDRETGCIVLLFFGVVNIPSTCAVNILGKCTAWPLTRRQGVSWQITV